MDTDDVLQTLILALITIVCAMWLRGKLAGLITELLDGYQQFEAIRDEETRAIIGP